MGTATGDALSLLSQTVASALQQAYCGRCVQDHEIIFARGLLWQLNSKIQIFLDVESTILRHPETRQARMHSCNCKHSISIKSVRTMSHGEEMIARIHILDCFTFPDKSSITGT
jgi:hypothetical protein